jgi:menaquinone-dependent protoporphyrinogen IX oxidase
MERSLNKGEYFLLGIAEREIDSWRQKMVHDHKACSISTTDFDTNIFDLDGVITDTASVHAQAWKQMFDDFLTRHAQRENVPFQPFVIETDYRSYVDGKPSDRWAEELSEL